jgi:hypothetical protein
LEKQRCTAHATTLNAHVYASGSVYVMPLSPWDAWFPLRRSWSSSSNSQSGMLSRPRPLLSSSMDFCMSPALGEEGFW